MQLGNTYIEKQVSYWRLEHPEIVGEHGKQVHVLEALAFESMGARLATGSAVHHRTCEWLSDTGEHTEWRRCLSSCSRRRILWIKGKPGAGKSMIMVYALQEG